MFSTTAAPASLPAVLSTAFAAALPTVTTPIRLDDLPSLLGPYAKTAPIFVYLMDCGNLKASRFRLGDEGDLILILGPTGHSLPVVN